jgi:hypothetical protein
MYVKYLPITFYIFNMIMIMMIMIIIEELNDSMVSTLRENQLEHVPEEQFLQLVSLFLNQ